MRLVGEAVDAIGQVLRQPAGQERILGFVFALDAEQHAAEAHLVVALGRQRQVAAAFRLKARGVGKGARLGADHLAHVFVIRLGDKPDRHRVGRLVGDEDRIHRKT